MNQLASNLPPKQAQATREVIMIRPYSTKDLARLYGVDRRTFRNWLEPFQKKIGERRGRFYNSLQVKIIFIKLGMPYAEWVEE